MNLYAHDQTGELVLANQAEKGIDYFCIECKTSVRLREGRIRQPHFYHIHSRRKCHQQGKSITHLQVQLYLQKLFPKNIITLERRFPTISRIADAVWESQKLVFEVQCSSMNAEEAQKRVHDYSSIGYEVIWILHDKKYNKWRESALEGFLNQYHLYYTNIDHNGKGAIYDVYRVIRKGVRKWSSIPFEVDLRKPIDREITHTLPGKLSNRNSDLYFSGDLLNRCASSEQFLRRLIDMEKKYQTPRENIFLRYFVRPYMKVVQILLEKVSSSH